VPNLTAQVRIDVERFPDKGYHVMLSAHFELIEKCLIARSEIVDTSGHSVHKGTPREAFVREFLQDHLPQNLSIGQGEIIDKDSQPREERHNIDVVLYRNEYPRLTFGGGVTAFLAESVVATIEVKSVLTKAGLKKATEAASHVKQLTRRFTSPALLQPVQRWLKPICEKIGIADPSSAPTPAIGPPIKSYVVAYKSKASIATTYSWLDPIYKELKLRHPKWGGRLVNGSTTQRPPWTAFLF
jgi:hypothetical protein